MDWREFLIVSIIVVVFISCGYPLQTTGLTFTPIADIFRNPDDYQGRIITVVGHPGIPCIGRCYGNHLRELGDYNSPAFITINIVSCKEEGTSVFDNLGYSSTKIYLATGMWTEVNGVHYLECTIPMVRIR